jgi:hypothetical protein
MKKQLNPIAVITTSKFHFERYVNENRLQFSDVKQVQVLSDIKGIIFDYAVQVDGSENVTQYVIDRVQTTKSLNVKKE